MGRGEVRKAVIHDKERMKEPILFPHNCRQNKELTRMGQFWTPITPEGWSLLHADSQGICFLVSNKLLLLDKKVLEENVGKLA